MAAQKGSLAEVTACRPWETPEWAALAAHAESVKSSGLHLRDLITEPTRATAMSAEFGGITLDYSRQLATAETLELLLGLAKASKLEEKRALMASGARLNICEDRAVLHAALRAPATKSILLDGVDQVPIVLAVRAKIDAFATSVRDGTLRGATGLPITNVISVGIGGSYLGPEFVYEALKHDATAHAAADGRALRFLANVDPIDVSRAVEGLDPATTLVIVISKTFTTAETMLNARTLKRWLVSGVKAADASATDADIIAKHMCACSSNVDGAVAFGLDAARVFALWNWVGGRYSVCSAVGVLPLSLQYGTAVVNAFLAGAHAMDEHFFTAPLASNLPVLLGLFGVWNSTFLGHATRALLPYSQALLRFPAHIQQVDMESNGKRVAMDGTTVPFPTGEINFGEPGTNGQHSFYQLLHQGTVVPADFIGVCRSQTPRTIVPTGKWSVSNHDELMSNFFAQPDALACGLSEEELPADIPAALRPHKVFPGNRPSSSILLDCLDPAAIGSLLALYEHRTAVQGFAWGICSFDQWGVELGKKLGVKARLALAGARGDAAAPIKGDFNGSTKALMAKYLAKSG